MPTIEGVRLKILKYRRKWFANYRNKKIKNKNFTIISNNCWAGMIYESYNLPKQSPTVGLYFYAPDYIKFIKNLKKYVNCSMEFITLEESKWKDYVVKNDKKAGTYPIGKIDDIEIFFLHYKSEKEVTEKWNRRCKRINWDRIIYKFNDQNGCTEDNVRDFFNLKLDNKVFFTCKDWENKNKSIIKISQLGSKESIRASYEPIGKNKYIDLNKFINNI